MTTPGIVTRLIPETVIPGRRLGRHVAHDDRSWDFPAALAPAIVSVNHASTGLPLNQGSIGSCTANALCGALNSAPDHIGVRALDETDAVALYELETKMEGEPYPPNDPGGTGLLVCKAAKDQGLLTSSRHAFGINQALRALVLRPVITGVHWYTSFDTPGVDGLVAVADDATVRGGHEVVADGIDAERRLVWLWNSWGPSYGLGGRFCMSFDTWNQLLQEQGDVTVPLV
jgi:hypothetical protein